MENNPSGYLHYQYEAATSMDQTVRTEARRCACLSVLDPTYVYMNHYSM